MKLLCGINELIRVKCLEQEWAESKPPGRLAILVISVNRD